MSAPFVQRRSESTSEERGGGDERWGRAGMSYRWNSVTISTNRKGETTLSNSNLDQHPFRSSRLLATDLMHHRIR